MSDQLNMLQEINYQETQYSLSEALAKILALLENVPEWKEKGAVLSGKQLGSLMKPDHRFLCGKTLREPIPATKEGIFKQYCESLPTLGVIDLNGNCLTQVGYYPKIESEFTLLDILQDEVSPEYFLSQKMIDYLTSRTNQTADGHKPNIVPQQ